MFASSEEANTQDTGLAVVAKIATVYSLPQKERQWEKRTVWGTRPGTR